MFIKVTAPLIGRVKNSGKTFAYVKATEGVTIKLVAILSSKWWRRYLSQKIGAWSIFLRQYFCT
jgi:hypothetical protein